MDVILYEEEKLKIVKKDRFIYVKSQRQVSLDTSIQSLAMCNKFRLELEIHKFLFVLHFNQKLMETLTEDLMSKIDSSLESFMYETKIAVVPKRKFLKNMSMLTMLANTHNINSKVFSRVRDAKAWLLED